MNCIELMEIAKYDPTAAFDSAESESFYVALVDQHLYYYDKHNGARYGKVPHMHLLLQDWRPYTPIKEWAGIATDTKVLYQDSPNTEWKRGHFARIVDGKPTVWTAGMTSWTTSLTLVPYAIRLVEEVFQNA